MPNRILFVFEGEKSEKQITNNLTKFFINENIIIQCAFCTDIYQLHREISADEDLDIFTLLKEKPQNSIILGAFNRNDFAEIYLFFDYDGHATQANDNKIEASLNLFNEETSMGKLYISYPMVEALKHYSDSLIFKDLKVNAKVNVRYKNIVSKQCSNKLKNFTRYSFKIWKELMRWSSLAGQFFDKVKLRFLKKEGSESKVILKFSGDPCKEVSKKNFGNNFDPGQMFSICLCN